MIVPVVKEILKADDQVALENRAAFDAAGVAAVNVMGSPGAGKTALIMAAVERLSPDVQPGVIAGGVASSLDADRFAARSIPVVQVHTGGCCMLDASMVHTALLHLDLPTLDLLFIENVGNLICPADYTVGADLNLVVPSVPEGHDKPYKYPDMFAAADIAVLNKADLLAGSGFNLGYFECGVRMVNPDVEIFHVSSRTGAGVEPWLEWLLQRLGKRTPELV